MDGLENVSISMGYDYIEKLLNKPLDDLSKFLEDIRALFYKYKEATQIRGIQ
jgi:hypothetical protein